MTVFKYNKNKLFCESLSILKITKKIKTPFYLYSNKLIVENYKNFVANFKKIRPLICFSVKANSNLSILKVLKSLGSGADVVSAGELLKVIKSGIKPKKIVFSGVGKSEEEIRLAIKNKILLINVESESEAILVNKISGQLRKRTSIGIRLNPDIKASTHRKISTGKSKDKFGLSRQNIISFCKKINNLKNINLDAISVHIGSQILNDFPFRKTLVVLSSIIKDANLKLKYVDLGGGFGIPYEAKDSKINLRNYSKLVYRFKKKYNCNIIFEPGRSIIGNSGVLVSKIQFIKKNKNKTFAVLDAGMNDFMRPALYEAKHNIKPLVKRKKIHKSNIEFVGPICETTCKFIEYRKFQKIYEKDLVAILDVGAYGYSLASNYNTKPLPEEIMVTKNKFKVIKKRQSLTELLK